MYDIVIQKGTIVDGSGKERYVADLAVRDGLVAKIAPAIEDKAVEIIDADGLVVSPGFIDSHTHSDTVVLRGSDGYNYLQQGVTTQITGQCGSALVPFYDGLEGRAARNLGPEVFSRVREICDSFESFTKHVSGMKLGTNMAFYAGQGSLRGRVMDFSSEKPTEAQLEQMKDWLRQAMECGFLGFSTGLVYAPSVYAGTEELVELARVTAEFGGSYATHIRNEGNHLIESVKEAIFVAEQAGVPLTISHLKVIGKQNEGASREVLRLMEEADARGVRVRADQYPYTAGSAPFISQIPPKFATDGPQELVERLKDRAFRKEVEYAIFHEYDEFESNLYSAGYEGCLIVDSVGTPSYVGKTIAQIAKEEGKDPFDVCCDVLIANGGVVQAIYFAQCYSDMLRIMAHPFVAGGSDWSDYERHFDPDQAAGGHPRGTATMVRRMELIRDHGLRTLEDSVRSVTSLPAEMAGLTGVGMLKEGAAADICLFDYAALKATADFVNPFRHNEGIRYVLVNGQMAVRDGIATGIRAGRMLKRG